MTSKTTEWYHKRRKLVIEDYGGECCFCGTQIDLEFHHIRPTPLKGMNRGSWLRLRDVENYKDSYVLLCHFCHHNLHLLSMDD